MSEESMRGVTLFTPAKHIFTIPVALEYLKAAAEGDDVTHFIAAMRDAIDGLEMDRGKA